VFLVCLQLKVCDSFYIREMAKSAWKRGKLSYLQKTAQFPRLGFLAGGTGVRLFLEVCASLQQSYA
jgi:hypothetical protein